MAIAVDTGLLLALADASDLHHDSAEKLFGSLKETLVVPVSVLPELCYLVAKYLGSVAEARVVESLASGEGGLRIENLTREDLVRSAELISAYADSGIGFVDASVAAVAERLNIKRVLTLDRRHFGVIRPRHCEAFELVP